MKKKDSDRRIRKTKEGLRKELTQLLMDKDLKEISVSELTELADINRGTFYLHYKDVYDLFEQIEKEILDDFIEIITGQPQRDKFRPILLDAFTYVYENKDIFSAILRTRETMFLARLIELSRPKNKKEWQRLLGNTDEANYEYYYAFITFGCVALLKRWFTANTPETPDHMAGLAEQLMVNCIRIAE